MLDFMSGDAQKLSKLISDKENFSILIPEEITKFQSEIPNVDFTTAQEVPPTSAILTEEGIAMAMIHGGRDLQGLFTQLVVFVYARGGKIYYKKNDNGNGYITNVKW